VFSLNCVLLLLLLLLFFSFFRSIFFSFCLFEGIHERTLNRCTNSIRQRSHSFIHLRTRFLYALRAPHQRRLCIPPFTMIFVHAQSRFSFTLSFVRSFSFHFTCKKPKSFCEGGGRNEGAKTTGFRPPPCFRLTKEQAAHSSIIRSRWHEVRNTV